MKTKRKTFAAGLLTACNTAAGAWVEGINVAQGVFQEMALGEGDKESRYEFTRYGEYPVTIRGENGKPKRVIQVIDAEAANQMAEAFGTLRQQAATFFKGIPIYEGHADDPEWQRANPGYKPAAVGRIKEITAGNQGIEVRSVFNSRGTDMLSGEAPEYSGHSPRWRMKEIPGRPGYYRPWLLLSDALTNNPNIAGSAMALNQSQSYAAEMPEEIQPKPNEPMLSDKMLRRLGLKPEATESEIEAAIAKMLDKMNDAETAKNEAEENLTAANTKLEELQGTAVATAINTAITEGRITEAEKPAWEKLLKADFESGSEALNAKQATALNTKNQLGDQGERKGEGAPAGGTDIVAMNEAAHDYAREKGIDVTTTAGWDRAWNGARATKPEVFGDAKQSA